MSRKMNIHNEDLNSAIYKIDLSAKRLDRVLLEARDLYAEIIELAKDIGEDTEQVRISKNMTEGGRLKIRHFVDFLTGRSSRPY